MGSRDTSTWVFGAQRWENLIYYSLGGHKDVVVGCFFEKDSLDVSAQRPAPHHDVAESHIYTTKSKRYLIFFHVQ